MGVVSENAEKGILNNRMSPISDLIPFILDDIFIDSISSLLDMRQPSVSG